jgi:type III pantothenate kinase
MVIGRRTETCIQSGVFYQAVDAVDGIVRRIKDEWGRPEAYVVATGGYSNVVGSHLATVDEVEPFLTLYGLAMAGERMGASGPSERGARGALPGGAPRADLRP